MTQRGRSISRDEALKALRAIAAGTFPVDEESGYVSDMDEWYSPPPSEGAHIIADEILLRLIDDNEIRAAFDSFPKWYA